jgi:MarR-like DNA-binding transcriptional regulator SgrR of sgrS sRNA
VRDGDFRFCGRLEVKDVQCFRGRSDDGRLLRRLLEQCQRVGLIATRSADQRGKRSQIHPARGNERARGEKTEKSAARGRIWICHRTHGWRVQKQKLDAEAQRKLRDAELTK